MSGIVNAFTIDVEDYFQVSALAPSIPRESWPTRELRVERNMDVILGLLAERNVRGTFFVLGWVAERVPELVRKIAAAGHEIACHGYSHLLIYNQTRAGVPSGNDSLEALPRRHCSASRSRVIARRASRSRSVRSGRWTC